MGCPLFDSEVFVGGMGASYMMPLRGVGGGTGDVRCPYGVMICHWLPSGRSCNTEPSELAM